ncbi:transglutaminase-like putative cysteine protease [Paraburkholderia sp. MM5482-R1]
MKLRVGYELSYECSQPTPMMLMLNTHFSHAKDIVEADLLVTDPPVATRQYRDLFGNLCTRIIAPAGRVGLSTTALLNVPNAMETRPKDGRGHPVEQLPDDTLVFLLGSRYCETDLMVDVAWKVFGQCAPGRETVLAICDFVHRHIAFDYRHARPTKTAADVYRERRGRLPGLRPSGHHAMPRHEYSGSLLHRLYQRCRFAPRRSANGFRGVV